MRVARRTALPLVLLVAGMVCLVLGANVLGGAGWALIVAGLELGALGLLVDV